jgi:hypothetical protein
MHLQHAVQQLGDYRPDLLNRQREGGVVATTHAGRALAPARMEDKRIARQLRQGGAGGASEPLVLVLSSTDALFEAAAGGD